MRKWKPVAGVALVLLLGILIGSMGAQFYLKRTYHHFPDRKARAERLMRVLSKKLDLSEQQKAAIGQIVDQTEEKLHKHYLQARPEAERIVQESFSEIRKQLNEDQKKKLDILRERFQRHRHARDR
jgi:Spy/CpxP family protein refolding chaperone